MSLERTGRGVAAVALLLTTTQVALSETDPGVLAGKVQAIADAYVSDTAPSEQAPGISISISLPGGAAPVNIVSGRTGSTPNAAPMTPDTLFQISSIVEVNLWVRALFTSEALLDPAAQAELTELVPMRTGAPLDALSADDPTGFGLGVWGFLKAVGKGWQYEGETMGYRVLYVFLPERDLVATLAFNSAAEDAADHAGKIALEVITAALE